MMKLEQGSNLPVLRYQQLNGGRDKLRRAGCAVLACAS
jgi:hypothetical protein